MSTVMSHTGTVSKTDLKDKFAKTLEVRKTYHYRVENTGDHGRFRFVIRQDVDDFREEELIEDRVKHVKVTVKPGEVASGDFTVTDPKIGIPGDEYASVDFIVKYVVTLYKAHYSFRIWEM